MLNKWIVYENKIQAPKYRIFLFHHAGGAASFYKDWKKYFGHEIQVCPVQFPMRENRLSELSPNTIDEIIDDFIEDNLNLFDIPYILFGHSMGGVTAYEVAVRLEKKGIKPPMAIYISSANEPDDDMTEYTDDFSDESVKHLLASYGLMESSILANKDFMDLYLPIAKNDFKMCGKYHLSRRNRDRISTSIYALWGNSDEFIEEKSIMKWKNYTKGLFYAQSFPGNHFYLINNVQEISALIKKSIEMYKCGFLDSAV